MSFSFAMENPDCVLPHQPLGAYIYTPLQFRTSKLFGHYSCIGSIHHKSGGDLVGVRRTALKNESGTNKKERNEVMVAGVTGGGEGNELPYGPARDGRDRAAR
ncbi:hypothetical protein Trydic_g15779 [Trypoxylus dichotomus]